MEEKQTIITALAFIIAYGIPHTIFVLWYLYSTKKHVQVLYQKTANAGEQARDAKAMAVEAQQDLGLIKIQTTRNYL